VSGCEDKQVGRKRIVEVVCIDAVFFDSDHREVIELIDGIGVIGVRGFGEWEEGKELVFDV
jgi:hypothetical protein